MSLPVFTRKIIGDLDNSTATEMNTLFNVGDVNGDGRLDIITSGRSGRMAWFENRGPGRSWVRHVVAGVENQECGGLVFDLTGAGMGDIINGGDYRSDELAWWQNPGAGAGPWTRRIIAKTGKNQFHDELIGPVTNDGRQSLVYWNEGGPALYWLPLPEDPLVSPWPEPRVIARGAEVTVNGHPEEGLALADVDGDGKQELVAGTRWYKYTGRPGHEWDARRFAHDYISTVIAAGDIDGDGRPEIVMAEGDACIYGKPQGGKLAWFKPGDDPRELWEEHLLEDFLLDPHSVQLGDLCGSGRLDLLVGEIGVRDRLKERPPRLLVFENEGGAQFSRHVIDEGTGTHHARLADFRQAGALDIASRPLHGPEKWQVFIWYNDRGGPLST